MNIYIQKSAEYTCTSISINIYIYTYIYIDVYMISTTELVLNSQLQAIPQSQQGDPLLNMIRSRRPRHPVDDAIAISRKPWGSVKQIPKPWDIIDI